MSLLGNGGISPIDSDSALSKQCILCGFSDLELQRFAEAMSSHFEIGLVLIYKMDIDI